MAAAAAREAVGDDEVSALLMEAVVPKSTRCARGPSWQKCVEPTDVHYVFLQQSGWSTPLA